MANLIDEDYQAWELYPEHHWIFNKLEVALKLGYQAAPACVPLPRVSRTTLFKTIIRPIYNLYGMGIGAKTRIFRPMIDNEFIINHSFIPPGYFWCEYFEGIHYSIDYKRTNSPNGSYFVWEPFCAMIGEKSEDNLTKFTKWTCIEPPMLELPNFLWDINNVDFLNLECIDNKIIEIHLRTGNDIFHEKPINTVAIPIWHSDDPFTSEHKIKELEKQDYVFKPNLHPDSFRYNADGHLQNIRLGYMIK